MSKAKVKVIKRQENAKEVKGNIKIKEVKIAEDNEKKPVKIKEEFFVQENNAESKSSAPILSTEDIRPVRNLDEVAETPRRDVQETQRNVTPLYSEREPSRAMREYVETTSLGDVKRVDEETRRVYNPEKAEVSQRVEPRTEFRIREQNIVRGLRPITPSEAIEERRDVRNPRTEIEQIRGFYKEYEDVRKYEERAPAKERRRRI